MHVWLKITQIATASITPIGLALFISTLWAEFAFETYGAALQGKLEEALELETTKPLQSPGFTGPGTLVLITQINVRYRCISQIQSYDFTTERETVDCTRLGDAFRKQYDRINYRARIIELPVELQKRAVR